MRKFTLTHCLALFEKTFNCNIIDYWKRITKRLSFSISELIPSGNFRILIIAAMFISLIVTRTIIHSFAFSVGYLYFIAISLAGIWFGLRGGLLAATIAISIFIAEINIFKDWPFRDIVVQGASSRLIVFLLSGLVVGYISDTEKRLKERLRNLAYHDELTGCINYRWTMHLLENEIKRSERYKKEMTMIIIDIDHFKNVNDTYGHLVGNSTLKAFADVLKSSIRTIDIVGRYGGEEFIIIFPETDSKEAFIAIERIRKKLSRLRISGPHFKHDLDIPLKFSAGVVSFPLNGQSLETLLDMADKALYRAKCSGRDQIVVEKRRWKRIISDPGFKIEIIEPSVKKNLQPLKIKNISQKGMLLVFSDDIPAGELVLRMRFPGEEFTSEFKCKVIHKRSEEDFCYIGVYFVDIPVGIEKKILRYIKE